MRTLLADDSASIREQFTDMLRVFRQGEIPGSFTNGIKASESIQALKSDFSMAETKMPGLRGIEVIPSKRKAKRNIIFFHLGFFTIRVLPRKDHTSLLRLFF